MPGSSAVPTHHLEPWIGDCELQSMKPLFHLFVTESNVLFSRLRVEKLGLAALQGSARLEKLPAVVAADRCASQ
jgi:hypothetical protein